MFDHGGGGQAHRGRAGWPVRRVTRAHPNGERAPRPKKAKKRGGGDTRGTAGGMHVAREAVVEACGFVGVAEIDGVRFREGGGPSTRASLHESSPGSLAAERLVALAAVEPRPRQSCARLHPPPSVIPASRALAHPLACARVGPALALCALRRDALPDLSGRLRALHAHILLHALLCALRVEGARAARGGQVGVRVDAHLHTCRHRRRGWVAPQSGGAPGGRCTRGLWRARRTPPSGPLARPRTAPPHRPPSRGEPTTERLTGHHPARAPVSEPTANLKILNTGSRRPFGEPRGGNPRSSPRGRARKGKRQRRGERATGQIPCARARPRRALGALPWPLKSTAAMRRRRTTAAARPGRSPGCAQAAHGQRVRLAARRRRSGG